MKPGSRLAAALLSWYDANRRELPWRKTSGTARAEPAEAYSVLVSEFMLQQTTVTAVIPYFERWMRTYPTVKALAGADEEGVIRAWEGLGYYSRARNLHAAAKEISTRYGGQVPREPLDLKKLPGIGEYTAAAVASIAYGARVPALDANNIRVWSRLLATSDKKRIAAVFGRIIPADRSGDFNQALMDLGSSVCTPKAPRCAGCPLAAWCRALRLEQVELFPQKRPRPETTHIEAAIGIILKDGTALVQKRPQGGLFSGMWEFPGGKIRGSESAYVRESVNAKNQRTKQSRSYAHTLHAHTHIRKPPPGESPEEAMVREVREETGLRVQVCEKLGIFTHTYTRFRVKLHVFICKREAGTVTNPEARWVTLEELEALPMPGVNRRIVRKFEERLKAGCGERSGPMENVE
ncbi:MAG: A/G-specific adenine glycosylase [bacterium]|nr:A/G-specific adenine glycosylase [bacterium]MDT8396254.1 A/G-specific adenine glycosylase [bacterium]